MWSSRANKMASKGSKFIPIRVDAFQMGVRSPKLNGYTFRDEVKRRKGFYFPSEKCKLFFSQKPEPRLKIWYQ